MKSISGREFARIVERRGWHIYGREGSVVRLTIPIHGNASLKIGLLRYLMKSGDIREDEL